MPTGHHDEIGRKLDPSAKAHAGNAVFAQDRPASAPAS
jgi:hypothetical protein